MIHDKPKPGSSKNVAIGVQNLYEEEQKAFEERNKAMHEFQVEQQHVHERQVEADAEL